MGRLADGGLQSVAGKLNGIALAECRPVHDDGGQDIHRFRCPALRRKTIPCAIKPGAHVRHVLRSENAPVHRWICFLFLDGHSRRSFRLKVKDRSGVDVGPVPDIWNNKLENTNGRNQDFTGETRRQPAAVIDRQINTLSTSLSVAEQLRRNRRPVDLFQNRQSSPRVSLGAGATQQDRTLSKPQRPSAGNESSTFSCENSEISLFP
jgi:hypothetical protein